MTRVWLLVTLTMTYCVTILLLDEVSAKPINNVWEHTEIEMTKISKCSASIGYCFLMVTIAVIGLH